MSIEIIEVSFLRTKTIGYRYNVLGVCIWKCNWILNGGITQVKLWATTSSYPRRRTCYVQLCAVALAIFIVGSDLNSGRGQ